MGYQIRTYPQIAEEELAGLYQRAASEGIFDWVAHDAVMDLGLFKLVAKRALAFAVVYADGQATAFFFLGDGHGRTAQVHFGIFKDWRGRRLEIGRAALDWCFSTFDLQCLISCPPVSNQAAVAYAFEMGGRRLGLFPGYCWMEREQRAVDAVIFVFDKPEVS
jgi:RimJ/RimL family protein N-acetyltransferase